MKAGLSKTTDVFGESSSSIAQSSSSSGEGISNGSSSSSAGSLSSSSVYAGTGGKGTLMDYRDLREYNTVLIGAQTWMAENLDYEAEGFKCYEDKPENCAKYGRLYNWETAMEACPEGWHLPANAEWNELYHYADGTLLKSASGWNNNGNGTDAYGFAALPGGGYGYSDGGFYGFDYAGSSGYWWSSSERSNESNAYIRNLDYGEEGAYWNHGSKTFMFSVRCLQD